jgi:hypothetical protein
MPLADRVAIREVAGVILEALLAMSGVLVAVVFRAAGGGAGDFSNKPCNHFPLPNLW